MRHSKQLLAKCLLIAWAMIALSLFPVAERAGYVQLFLLPSWSVFLAHVARIAPVSFTLNLLGAWLGVALFSTACLALGLRVIQSTDANHVSSAGLLATAFVVGEIMFSLIFLTLISVYRLTSVMVAGIVFIGFILGARPLARLSIPSQLSSVWDDFRPAEKPVLALVAFVGVVGLFYSAARLGYDATAEYFSHAKLMAVSGKPVYTYVHDLYLVSAFHPSILFTGLIQLFGDQSARMLSWVNGLAIVLLAMAIASEVGARPRVQLWLLSLIFTSTAFVDLLGDGKVELISTAPMLAATYWMIRSLREPRRGIFALTGLLVAFSMIARPYNVFLGGMFIALFYLIYLLVHWRAEELRFWSFVRPALWALPPLLALVAFHLWQNLLWLENPLAPIAYTRGLSASNWQWQFDPSLLPYYRLLYPFTVTYANSPQSLGNISPLLVAFLPFLALPKIRQAVFASKTAVWLAIAAGATLIAWITLSFTVVEIRYVLFLWILLFIPAALILERFAQQIDPPIRPLLPLLSTLLLAYTGLRVIVISLDTYSPIDAHGQAHCFDIGFCTVLDRLNQSSAPGDRVLILNAYHYYLRPDLFACASQSNEFPKLESLAHQGSSDFWVQVYRQGFRYVAYEKHYAEARILFGSLPPTQNLPSWLHITELTSTPDGQQIVYHIEASNAPIKPETYCEQETGDTWQVRSGVSRESE